MDIDLDQLTRDELAEHVGEQLEEIAAMRPEIQALDDRTVPLTRQLVLVRLTLASRDDGFWSVERVSH